MVEGVGLHQELHDPALPSAIRHGTRIGGDPEVHLDLLTGKVHHHTVRRMGKPRSGN